MLGSHNTLTAYPCRWYMKIANIWSKCQEKQLTEQAEAGVRFFDIRVKLDKYDTLVYAHGIVQYDFNETIYHLLTYLSYLADEYKTTFYYRIVLEHNKCPKDWQYHVKRVKEELDWCTKKDNLVFTGAYSKWDEKCFLPGNSLPITHKYSSVLGWKRFLWIPWVYAKLHNKKFKKQYKDIIDSDNEVLMLDFV